MRIQATRVHICVFIFVFCPIYLGDTPSPRQFAFTYSALA